MFNNNNNKALLWSVLQNNNVFQGFTNDDFSYVHQEFEKQIHNCCNGDNCNTFQQLRLIEQNKQFISNFRDFLSLYRNSKINTIDNKQPLFNNSSKTIINDDSKQQNIFEQRLREKQREFEDLIRNPKPDTIDFSDKDQVNNETIILNGAKEENDSTNNIQSSLIKERNYENISENNKSHNGNINTNANINNQNVVPIELFNKLLQHIKIIEDKVGKQEEIITILKEEIQDLKEKNINDITPKEELFISHRREV